MSSTYVTSLQSLNWDDAVTFDSLRVGFNFEPDTYFDIIDKLEDIEDVCAALGSVSPDCECFSFDSPEHESYLLFVRLRGKVYVYSVGHVEEAEQVIPFSYLAQETEELRNSLGAITSEWKRIAGHRISIKIEDPLAEGALEGMSLKYLDNDNVYEETEETASYLVVDKIAPEDGDWLLWCVENAFSLSIFSKLSQDLKALSNLVKGDVCVSAV